MDDDVVARSMTVLPATVGARPRWLRLPAGRPGPAVPAQRRTPTSGWSRADPAWRRRYAAGLAAGDTAAVVLGAMLSGLGGMRPRAGLAAVGLAVGWAGYLWLSGSYRSRGLPVRFGDPVRFRQACLRAAAVLAVGVLVLDRSAGRRLVLVALPLAVAVGLALRLVLRARLRAAWSRGASALPLLAVATERGLLELGDPAALLTQAGLRVVGVCLTDGTPVLDVTPLPVLGGAGDVEAVAHGLGVAGVLFCGGAGLAEMELRELRWRLERDCLDVVVRAAPVDVTEPRLTVAAGAGAPLLHLGLPELSGVRRAVKHGFDRLAALCALVALSPLLLTLGLLVRATSPGPALFRQRRVRRDGATFTCLKFRSMHVGAEAQLEALQERNKHVSGPMFKIVDDPRITALGRFLRRYSLDELPQLLNVLGGSMSLVGPRPPLPHEVAQYSRDVRRRQLVKPGMTGLWQVSGRSALSWDESVRIDLHYIDNWSLSSDVRILGRTVTAVLRGAGAY